MRRLTQLLVVPYLAGALYLVGLGLLLELLPAPPTEPPATLVPSSDFWGAAFGLLFGVHLGLVLPATWAGRLLPPGGWRACVRWTPVAVALGAAAAALYAPGVDAAWTSRLVVLGLALLGVGVPVALLTLVTWRLERASAVH